MVNLLTALNPILWFLLKFYGLCSRTIEIQPGTVVHFWAPNHIIETYKNQTNEVVKSSSNVEKPALVFLHGFAATGVLTWLLQITAFARTHEVFVPDLLFFGSSTTDRAERCPNYGTQTLPHTAPSMAPFSLLSTQLYHEHFYSSSCLGNVTKLIISLFLIITFTNFFFVINYHLFI